MFETQTLGQEATFVFFFLNLICDLAPSLVRELICMLNEWDSLVVLISVIVDVVRACKRVTFRLLILVFH